MILTFACVASFVLGYLARRWHRPVGHAVPVSPTSESLSDGEWRVSVVGGVPYRAITAQGRFPVAPLGLAELLTAMDKAPAPLSDPL